MSAIVGIPLVASLELPKSIAGKPIDKAITGALVTESMTPAAVALALGDPTRSRLGTKRPISYAAAQLERGSDRS